MYESIDERLFRPWRTPFCLLIGVLIHFTFLLASIPAEAQSLTYKIIWNGKLLGSMEADKKPFNQGYSYSFKSAVTVSFVKRFKIDYYSRCFYQKNDLQEATTRNEVNGQRKDYSHTSKGGQGYVVNKNGKRSILNVSTIHHSLSTLYFQEPLQVSRIFSERHAVMLPVEQTAPHCYVITMPDGKKNTYWFANGICAKAEVNLGFGKLFFIRQSYSTTSSLTLD